MPSQFQSYLIVGPQLQKVREKTTDLAKSLKINLAKTSPDIFFIIKQKSSISIEQIRELKNHIFQKPVSLPFKFVVVENADSLTPEAQNSLLKILEKPPQRAILVLETQNKNNLLSTVLSRLTKISVVKKEKTSAQIFAKLETVKALEQVADITNIQEFLDEQIEALTGELVEKSKGKKSALSQNQLVSFIEKYAQAKKMCQANVNEIFVLTNLILSTNQTSE